MSRGSAGYSLLELLVVLAIMALISSVAAPTLIGGSDRIVLAADARAVATQLRAWRDEALDGQREVTIAPADLVLSSGTSADLGAKSFTIGADGGAGVRVRLSRGNTTVTVVMDRLTGRVAIEDGP